MGAVCYKPKPATLTKEDVLRALTDKMLRETISPFGRCSNEVTGITDVTKAISTANIAQEGQANGRAFKEAGGRLTPKHEDTHGEMGGDNHGRVILKSTSQVKIATMPYFNLIKTAQNKQASTTEHSQAIDSSQFSRVTFRRMNLVMSQQGQDEIQIRIMGYFGVRDQVYDTLSQMSRKSLNFMRKNRDQLEQQITMQAQDRARFISQKSIEEHQSGVNQIMRLSTKEIVTASDDCFLKYWSLTQQAQNQQQVAMKPELSISTETITCLAVSGQLITTSQQLQKRELLLAGCHSGNLLIFNSTSLKPGISAQQVKKEQITNAHYNLIRVIVSLETLRHRYFVTADVCGIVKVWTSQTKPASCLEIDLEQAMSYNSMIELEGVLPSKSVHFQDTAMIACALKNQQIHLIVLRPTAQAYQIIRTLKTQSQKPTCITQITSRHIAVAVGSLKEPARIEIHEISSINQQEPIAVLNQHTDMIDSLIKVTMPKPVQSRTHQSNTGAHYQSPNVQWLVSASRDRQLTLWKFYDGHPMRRSQANLANSLKRQSQSSRMLISDRMSAEDYLKNRSYMSQQHQIVHNNDEEDDEDNNEKDEEENKSMEKTPLIKKPQAPKPSKKRRVEQMRSGGARLVIESGQFEESKQLIEDDDDANDEEGGVRFKSSAASPETHKSHGAGAFFTYNRSQIEEQESPLIDYHYSIDSGHKDFVRSMVQGNDDQCLITASEDKSIKVFTLTCGNGGSVQYYQGY